MATQVLTYLTCDKNSCATTYPVDVVLCVKPSKLAANDVVDPTHEFKTLDAILTNIVKGCGGAPTKYEFSYDDVQIAEGQTLYATDVTGFFCKGCLSDWILDLINVCVIDSSSIDFDKSGACITGEVIISPDEGNALESLANGLFVEPAVGGGWGLLGNSGTDPLVNFLGTIDEVDLIFKVNSLQVLKFQQTPGFDDTPNIIGGSSVNSITGNTPDSNVICGGGTSIFPNAMALSVSGSDCSGCFIGAGRNNLIQGSFQSGIIIGNNNLIAEDDSNSVIVNGDYCQIFTSGGGVSNNNFIGACTGVTLENCIYSSAVAASQCALSGTEYSAIIGGGNLNLGTISCGYQDPNSVGSFVDLTAFSNIAYFGDVDIWVANVGGTAKKLKFIEPNTDLDYSSANYSSFEAQAQSTDIEYKLPAALPTPGQVLTASGVAGSVVTLSWV